jgi:ABC-type multidrug transport system ATPase subunit
VLLGHNGAGKTTTISMLTNAVKATSGSATAYGVNLLNDFSNAVDMVGLCPQETVLLYKLTVRENILFFLKFKGFENPEQVVTQQLQNLGMLHKDGALASSLSGG